MLSLNGSEEITQQDLTSYDILLGRTRRSKMHTGNVAFRTLVAARTELYRSSTTRGAKIHVVVSLTDSVYETGGRFLNPRNKGDDNTVWVEVGRSYAREKVGNSIRDGVKLMNKGKEPSGSAANFKYMCNQTSSFAEIVDFLERDATGGNTRPRCSKSLIYLQTKPTNPIPSLAPSLGPTTSMGPIDLGCLLGIQNPQGQTLQDPVIHSIQVEEPLHSLDCSGLETGPENQTTDATNVLGILLKERAGAPPESTLDLDDLSSILTLDGRLDEPADDFDDESSFGGDWVDEEETNVTDFDMGDVLLAVV